MFQKQEIQEAQEAGKGLVHLAFYDLSGNYGEIHGQATTEFIDKVIVMANTYNASLVKCSWAYDENVGGYETECGKIVCLPLDNVDGQRCVLYCPFCGKELHEAG